MSSLSHIISVFVFSMQRKLGISESVISGMLSGGGGGRGKDGGGDRGDAAAAVVAEVVEPEKEKDAFDIKLTVVDPKSKIKIIKEVRALTGLGLKEVSYSVSNPFLPLNRQSHPILISFFSLRINMMIRRKIWLKKLQ